MGTIHVRGRHGGESAYTEEQLRALWEQGILPADQLYRTEGMSDWRPLPEYFRHAPSMEAGVAPSLAQPGVSGGFTYTKDPRRLTKFLKAMLWVCLGMAVLSLVSDVAELILLRSGSFTEAQAEANDLRQDVIALLYVPIYIVTGIVFLTWIYRANVNCRGFGAQELEFRPGWSVGYYFIPFLNFYKPYYAMVEIWKASKNPLDWRNQPHGAVLPRWWGLWLAACVLGHASLKASMGVETMGALQAGPGVSEVLVYIASDVVDIPLCIVALCLVSGISLMQEKLVGRPA